MRAHDRRPRRHPTCAWRCRGTLRDEPSCTRPFPCHAENGSTCSCCISAVLALLMGLEVIAGEEPLAAVAGVDTARVERGLPERGVIAAIGAVSVRRAGARVVERRHAATRGR